MADQPSVVFYHATGFHGRCWDEIIRQLAGVHCVVMDTPGHGRSELPNFDRTWQQYGSDAAGLVTTMNLTGAVGVGHSMGGNMVVRAAAQNPAAFSHLLLIDPVIFPREQFTHTSSNADDHFVLNRRREFASVEDMMNRFRGRGPFKNWHEQILQDYCQFGVRKVNQHYELACPPELEAHIYSGARMVQFADIHDAVATVPCPVTVIRCSDGVAKTANDLDKSPTAPDLASTFTSGTDHHHPEHSHFMPMEAPDTIATYIKGILQS
ncbi:MAG: alpha/beta hydrolase [Chloroflexota bacterium]